MTAHGQVLCIVSARDMIVRHLESSPRDLRMLKQRLANVGLCAYHMTIAELCPGLPATYFDDVAEAVSRVLRARAPKMIRRVRRAA